MQRTTYSSKDLTAIARRTARDAGKRYVAWSVDFAPGAVVQLRLAVLCRDKYDTFTLTVAL